MATTSTLTRPRCSLRLKVPDTPLVRSNHVRRAKPRHHRRSDVLSRSLVRTHHAWELNRANPLHCNRSSALRWGIRPRHTHGVGSRPNPLVWRGSCPSPPRFGSTLHPAHRPSAASTSSLSWIASATQELVWQPRRSDRRLGGCVELGVERGGDDGFAPGEPAVPVPSAPIRGTSPARSRGRFPTATRSSARRRTT